MLKISHFYQKFLDPTTSYALKHLLVQWSELLFIALAQDITVESCMWCSPHVTCNIQAELFVISYGIKGLAFLPTKTISWWQLVTIWATSHYIPSKIHDSHKLNVFKSLMFMDCCMFVLIHVCTWWVCTNVDD